VSREVEQIRKALREAGKRRDPRRESETRLRRGPDEDRRTDSVRFIDQTGEVIPGLPLPS
jgi:hypothetical protein